MFDACPYDAANRVPGSLMTVQGRTNRGRRVQVPRRYAGAAVQLRRNPA